MWLRIPASTQAKTTVSASPSPQKTRYSDDVVSFASDITVNENTSLSVQETIVYATTQEKHGIYRYIPYQYVRDGKTVSAIVSGIVVKDANNDNVPVSTSRSNGNVVLKIGDPDQTFTGDKTYTIAYSVENPLLVSNGITRLYWDITGDGWQIPVHASTATIHSPFADVSKSQCYSGAYGGNDNGCQIQEVDKNTITVSYPQTITYGDNLTIDVTFSSPNSLQFPTPTQLLLQSILHNAWMVFLLIPPFASIYIWNKYGRDLMFRRYDVFNQGDGEIIKKPLFQRFPPPMVYEPLAIEPGMAGLMLDERYDNQDLVADIVDLARKKLLTIEETTKKSLFVAADYTLVRTTLKPKGLSPHQQLLLQELFQSGEKVTLKSLKGTFYASYQKIQKAAYDDAFSDHFFTRNPNSIKLIVGSISIASLVVVFMVFKLMEVTIESEWGITSLAIILPIIDIVSVILMVTHLTQKTAVGFNYWMQARGLRETIRRGAWREEIMEKHLFFEEMLPFAISLGVVDKLAKDMKGLNIEPPSYLHVSTTNALFASSFVNSFSSGVQSSLTVNPNSSSWSSSGGGFSGGGGGGGGGGSW